MLYSKTMLLNIISVVATQDCRVPGSLLGTMPSDRWTRRTEMCDADHVWNYAELGPEGGLNAKAWGQTHILCKNDKLVSWPGVGGMNPAVSQNLCLEKSKVDAREKNLGALKLDNKDSLNDVLRAKIEKHPYSQ